MKCEIDPDAKFTRTSHPVRGAWIEIKGLNTAPVVASSHPVRGAWIEMQIAAELGCSELTVAPRQGCVD